MDDYNLDEMTYKGHTITDLMELNRAYRVLLFAEWIAETHPQMPNETVFRLADEATEDFFEMEFGEEECNILYDVFNRNGIEW